MNEFLKKRIQRKLDVLSDEMGYRVLDYVEFLESKYAERSADGSPIEKIADTVEDALRLGKMPVAAIRGTMQVMDSAGKLVQGISAAGRAVVEEIQKATGEHETPEESKEAAMLDHPEAPE